MCPTIVNSTEAYSPSNNSWIKLKPMPTARFQLSSNVVNDVIYVIGGDIFNC